MNINETLNLEEISSQNSLIHNLDGRIKLISTLIIIVYVVFSNQLFIPIFLEVFLLIAMFLANLSYKDSFKRIFLLLPFGGFIILFQPFIQPGTIIWQTSFFNIHITDVGLNWAILLFSRLIVSLTAIVILSSTSPMQEIVQSFKKLGLPNELSMILSIMVRFLFIFIDELESIRNAQKSRNFHIHSRLTPYRWRILQVGYSIAMMFLKAYEKGERTYYSMLSRGFNENSEMYQNKSRLDSKDYLYILIITLIIVISQILVIFYPQYLGFFAIALHI